MKNKGIFAALLDMIFPPRCVFCNEILLPGAKVCKKCAKEIIQINHVKCIVLPASGKAISCVSPFAYENKIRQSILQFKFHGHRNFAGIYAEKMAELVQKQFPEISFDFITSVPISSERRKIRGYNQSELLARSVSQCLSVPYDDCLVKIKNNREQHKLSEKERFKNVLGVYQVENAEKISGKSVLLVDDIVTTGATLSACAAMLYQNGAKFVACATVAEV